MCKSTAERFACVYNSEVLLYVNKIIIIIIIITIIIKFVGFSVISSIKQSIASLHWFCSLHVNPNARAHVLNC